MAVVLNAAPPCLCPRVASDSGADDIVAPHGIPTDLLDRVTIIRTLPYTVDEMATIISIRAKTEGLTTADGTVALLAQIADQTSLRYKTRPSKGTQERAGAHLMPIPLTAPPPRARARYAVQLLTPASILAKSRGKDAIEPEDVEQSRTLFFDAKTSAKILVQNATKYIS